MEMVWYYYVLDVYLIEGHVAPLSRVSEQKVLNVAQMLA